MTEKAPAMVACTVLRDYWPKADERVPAGTIIHVTPDEAMDGIENGTLSRVKK